jgi:hypothetical protein
MLQSAPGSCSGTWHELHHPNDEGMHEVPPYPEGSSASKELKSFDNLIFLHQPLSCLDSGFRVEVGGIENKATIGASTAPERTPSICEIIPSSRPS